MQYRKQPRRLPEKILDSAVRALIKWNTSSLTLDECINDIRNEKSAVSILFLYFRHKSAIDRMIRNAAAKGAVKQPLFEIAACAITQILFQNGISPESAVYVAVDYTKGINPRLGGFMNALLRNVHRSTEKIPSTADFPIFIRERWTRQFGKDAAEHSIEACGINPPVSFRLRGPGDPPDGAERINCIPNFRFYFHNKASAILESEAFQKGKCYIQDPATGLSVSLCGELPEHAEILDVCAAPGGKTVMLSDKYPDAVITAADKSEKRLKLLQENMQRLNLSVKTVCSDALAHNFEPESFDLVFADVPCSNTGVFRRRPDAAWRFSEERLNDTVILQSRILDSLAPVVKRGGLLLYSTCSIEPEEDESQICNFLKTHPEFILEQSERILPDFLHDGAFAARLRKNH